MFDPWINIKDSKVVWWDQLGWNIFKCTCTIKPLWCYLPLTKQIVIIIYRDTIACSSHGEQIFIYFEKIRFASQKIEFLSFCF